MNHGGIKDHGTMKIMMENVMQPVAPPVNNLGQITDGVKAVTDHLRQ
jgi:hypothetical protein